MKLAHRIAFLSIALAAALPLHASADTGNVDPALVGHWRAVDTNATRTKSVEFDVAPDGGLKMKFQTTYTNGDPAKSEERLGKVTAMHGAWKSTGDDDTGKALEDTYKLSGNTLLFSNISPKEFHRVSARMANAAANAAAPAENTDPETRGMMNEISQ